MEENNKVKNDKPILGFIFDIVSVVATAVIAVGVCFTFFVRTIQVSGNSMYPTLEDKEQVILQSVYTKPANGDIVVTAQPNKSADIEDVLVKRIIATGGQVVSFEKNGDGTYSALVDGERLVEPYINEPIITTIHYYQPVTVPEGYVYVMGDNRNASSDSRDNRVGMIREEYIMGKVAYKAAPLGPVE